MEADCYCITLRAASRRITAVYDEVLAPAGVNTAQFSMLGKIARGQPLTLTKLGKRMELDRSTVGRNVRVLEQMQLVATSRGADGREAVVSLTAEGRRALDAGRPLWERAQARVEETLGTQGAQALRSALDNL